MILLFLIFNLARFSADKMEILTTQEGGIRILKGNVRIEDDGTLITAANASLYDKKDMAIIAGSVRIKTERADIYTDTAYYYFREKKTLLKGKVKILSDSVEIHTPLIWFFNRENRATTDADITIRDKKGVQVSGRKGTYDLNKEKGWIYENPKLTIKKENEVEVTSNQMEIDNKKGIASGIGDVKLKSDKTTLKCDTLLFYTNEDRGVALGSPLLLDENNRVSGDSVQFFVKEDKLKSFRIIGNAKALYFTSEGDRIEVGGEEMELYWTENKMSRIEITNNSIGILYRKKE